MSNKFLFTASEGSKSTMTKKATIEVDVQGYKGITTFVVSDLMDWDAIIGHPMWHHHNTVMTVKDNRLSIQARGKMRYDPDMLNTVTETHVMHATATWTEDYDSACDSPISDDLSTDKCETETDEDTTDSSPSNSEEEPTLSHHTSNNDTQGRTEEQLYQMHNESPALHP